MIEKLVASLPNKSPQERLAMRRNAEAQTWGDDPKRAEQGRKFLAALDQFERQSEEEDRARLMNLPLVDRIIEAFRRDAPTDTQIALIKVVAENPGSTSTKLSQLIEWKGLTWQMHFGVMAKDREAFIQPAPPSRTRKTESGDDAKEAKLDLRGPQSDAAKQRNNSKDFRRTIRHVAKRRGGLPWRLPVLLPER